MSQVDVQPALYGKDFLSLKDFLLIWHLLYAAPPTNNAIIPVMQLIIASKVSKLNP